MVSKKSRQEIRVKKHMKTRNRFSGTAERPRLAVFRSNNHMYAQIIDDTVGKTLCAASTVEKEVKAELEIPEPEVVPKLPETNIIPLLYFSNEIYDLDDNLINYNNNKKLKLFTISNSKI